MATPKLQILDVPTHSHDEFKNIYVKDEADSLLDAHSIELKKTITLTGDELTKKTADYIHVSKITNNNAVEFGKEFSYSGSQYFGYVGVKKAAVASGVSYMMVAEIDIETELDIDGIQVSKFYRPNGGTGADDTSLNIIIGKLKQGKNYILCPFTASDHDIDGFYMDSRTSGTNEVKFTLQDVRLYRRHLVEANFNAEGLKDWKCEILTNGNFIVSEIGEYSLTCNGTNLITNSLSGAMNVEVILYKPFQEVFPTKEAFEALSGTVSEKGLVYEHYAAGEKCILEPGCFYYLRNNSSQNKTFDWYKEDGSALADSDGNDLGAFKEAFVITTNNNYLGSHMNIALIPSTLSISSKAFYIDVKKPNIYVKSSSDALSVWKVKP